MAKAVIVTLADEVTDALNKKAGSFAASFVAERRYQPKVEFEEIDQLKVLVMMAAWRVSPDNRTEWEHEYDIDIGLFFRGNPKAGPETTARYDDLLLLLEQISDYWDVTMPTIADCPLVGIAFGPQGSGQPYLQESIDAQNSLTTVIRLTFRKLR